MTKQTNVDSGRNDAQTSQLQNELFDVIVIGGSYVGTDIAMQLARSGAKVLLLAHADYGNYDFSVEVVFKTTSGLLKKPSLGVEKLHIRAPHLMVPAKIHYPKNPLNKLFKKNSFSGSVFKERFANKKLNASQLEAQDPFFVHEQYTGGFEIEGYRLDKIRLLIDTIKTAKHYGAVTLNHFEVKQIVNNNGTKTVTATDAINNNTLVFKAKEVVYAPELPQPEIVHQTGSNISHRCVYQAYVSKKRLPLLSPVVFDLPGNRRGYAIPRNEMVSLYFSSSEYSEFISDMMMAKLIKGFNLCLPSMSSKLEISDITASHFSFKSVLNHTERTQVELSPKGIYAVTVLRTSDVPLASDILLKMLKTPLNLTIPQGEVRLIASEFNFETSSFQNMVEFADEKFDEAKSTGIPSPKFQPIFYRYGSKVDDLTKHAYNTQGKYPVWESKWIESEVLNAIHKEDATSLHDFYAHRSTQLYFEYEWVDFSLPEVAEIMRIALKWTPEQTEEKIQYFRANFLKEAKA